jgi:hypothetical protein
MWPSVTTAFAKHPRPDDIERFTALGYLVLSGILSTDLVSRLHAEVDRWVDDGLRAQSVACCLDPDTYGLPPMFEIEFDAHGELVTYAPLMAVVEGLLGPSFAFHHLHSDRQAEGLGGKPWHHDYEQRPQSTRTHVMVHALHYLDGLGRDTSALVILPGSHRDVTEKSDSEHLGTRELAGEVVIDDLPPGSTVIVHSAVLHARRPPARRAGAVRYVVDVSYCQAGPRWRPVKPFWRHILRLANELGLDRGQWPDLFAEHHFDEYDRNP